MDWRPFIDECLSALHPSPLPEAPCLHAYAHSKLQAAQRLTEAYSEHFVPAGIGRAGVALRAAGLRLNDEWATAENLYSRAFGGHLTQARRSHHHALSLDAARFEMDVLERDRQLARRLEHVSGELRDSVDAIFDALEAEMQVDELGILMHNIIVFHLSVAAEVYHQVATLHLVAGSVKARERTERTVRKVCEFAEIKLGEFRRKLRTMARECGEDEAGDVDSETLSDEATDEDGPHSDIESVEGESAGG
ncbi:hypothetical protein CC85DRAFT_317368 [Cutaneotrichosporon oleaginosum]|uniref:Uncharacterized protein n=1 Tax=Cutaneotrichosporon oleaginosum TaxID=879819 RepID=A0A0J0XQC1_9TREE|nr:uncharacterized protein CC85DRAFT_317368 [Cutaneotrichosporon oleaginosum]KLT43321.1 hypothetical protein CC85DRAFT_317368 [Cutaneotrichosporon oleaginosum]TXT14417.1 hypothetical protein COLE_00610 [Cutaneotrichosporon oleaginosum]